MVQENLREKLLKRIKPKKQEIQKANSIAEAFIKEIRSEGFEAVLVGSLSRETFTSGDADIDIFVFFPDNTSRDELEKKGIELGKKVLRRYGPKTHYAEHPYVKGKVKGFDVEIVPCYRMKKGIISAVDRSPLHNEYIKKKMTEEQKNDVILLKQFLRTSRLYGADQKTKGFSGYLCELLILHYKNFDNLAREAAEKWNKRVVIDIEKISNSPEKFNDVLVVIDPVDKNRNVASAVSREAISMFILKARDYMREPGERFFIPEKRRINIKKSIKGRKMIIVTFKAPDVIPEILWSQLEKLAKNLKEELYANEFEVYKTGHWTDEKTKCSIVLEINTHTLGDYKRHKGPEVWDAGHCMSFIEKNPMWWVQRSVLYAWKERKFKKAVDAVENALKTDSVVPSHLKKAVEKRRILLENKAHKEKNLMIEHFS